MSATFKEVKREDFKTMDGWKTAEPADDAIRAKWWEMFGDSELNALEETGAISNQTIIAAVANLDSSRAVVKQARADFFPTVSLNPSITRSSSSQRQSVSGQNRASGTQYSVPVAASWEADFWGRIRNNVRANAREAEAASADLESSRLAVRTEIASDYFQLRTLDAQIDLLNSTVRAFEESLKLAQARFETGIASEQDVAQARTQLHSAAAQAANVAITRAQLEHAIALLIGKPASEFSIAPQPLNAQPIAVPFGVPSRLLERRPDIAAAERRVAAANARIGVARAAYFPTLTLSGSAGFENRSLVSLSSAPDFVWSIGAALAQSLFDAGKRHAITEQARATYAAGVANYRQAVLAALQEVEDNLAALRLLSTEAAEQQAAVSASEQYLTLATDRYKLGIDSYLNVVTAQAALLNNQRAALTVHQQQLVATVQLIRSLGGEWNIATR
jgi:NodT family efflux transporter outer membrane factor (OMF) lipoprotein